MIIIINIQKGSDMCFSATASFTAAAFLSIIGLLSLKKASSKFFMYASIPLLFSVQQAIEGFVWLLHTKALNNTTLLMLTSYMFLFFAFTLWPLWVPVSLFIAEKKKRKKRPLLLLIVLGVSISLYLTSVLYFYPITSSILNCHIAYTSQLYNISIIGIILYILATIVPFFISSISGTTLLGILLTISCCATWLIAYTSFTSVWCFFAALISTFIFIYLPHKKA